MIDFTLLLIKLLVIIDQSMNVNIYDIYFDDEITVFEELHS
jgi:hypothetical protein